MRMLVPFVLGLAGLTAAVLFCGPLRNEVQQVLLSEPLAKGAHKKQVQQEPIKEAADRAEQALKNAWDKASGLVTQTLKVRDSTRAQRAQVSPPQSAIPAPDQAAKSEPSSTQTVLGPVEPTPKTAEPGTQAPPQSTPQPLGTQGLSTDAPAPTSP